MNNLRNLYNIVRDAGIAVKVFSAKLPRAATIKLETVNEPGEDWAGMGGTTARGVPFIIINLAFANTLHDITATLAHEMLHIKQALNNRECGHGNDFRADCAKLAQAIGFGYYHVSGYDMPSVSAMKAHYAKKIRKIQAHHRGKAK